MAEPLQGEHPVSDRGAERSGEVVALFGPVDAVADRGAPAWQGIHVDAEGAEFLSAPGREQIGGDVRGAVVAPCLLGGE